MPEKAGHAIDVAADATAAIGGYAPSTTTSC